MTLDFDVIIIGGGPAGSLCAAMLKRRFPGRRVLVLEREAFPRPHVGEATLPGWQPVLDNAGVLEKVAAMQPIAKVGIVFEWGPPAAGESWTADFRESDSGWRAPPASWHVDRGPFDACLLDHAASLGAEVRTRAEVTGVQALPEPTAADRRGAPVDGQRVDGMRVRWTEGGSSHEAIAGHVIDASGQARFLAGHWGLPLRPQPDMNNFALFAYWRGSEVVRMNGAPVADERWAFIASCDFGWLWHIPISADVTSVGLVTDRDTVRQAGRDGLRALYDDALASCRTGKLLAGATFVGAVPDGSRPTELSVVRDWAYASERQSGPGFFLCGDTAMFVDPILSSGLTLASQGALMTANAITTLWTDPDVDATLLRASIDRRYRAIGDVYHRMARVWYRRNERATTWHWHAHRERLRGGGEAIYERASHAFTAISLGAVVDPIANAARPPTGPRLGNEFFAWHYGNQLFADAPGHRDRWTDVPDADAARTAARRAMLERWSRIARSKLALRAATPRERDAYTTHATAERWERLRFVEVAAGDLELAFPSLDGRIPAVLFALDASRYTDDIVRGVLADVAVGSDPYGASVVGIVEMLVQLDMLELLDVREVRAAPPLTGHPVLGVLIDAALRAIGGPGAVVAELDALGAQCLLTVTSGAHRHAFRVADAARADRTRFSGGSATTLVTHLGAAEPWADGWLGGLVARLVRHEAQPAAHALWSRCAELPSLELKASVSDDRQVMLEPLVTPP
jgi:flavin-dependent dehydrogenase